MPTSIRDYVDNKKKPTAKPELTAEEKAADALRFFNLSVSWAVERCQEKIKKFQEELSTDAQYAFEWSVGAFDAAAELKTYKYLVAMVEAHGLEEGKRLTREEAERELFRGARNPSSSTSQPSNIAKQSLTSAWAKMAEFLGHKW